MLRALDFIGVRHFIYGGDQDWVRRRWFMVVSMSSAWLFMIGACISTAFGRLPLELAQTIVTSVFAITAPVVLGYLGFATWDEKNKRESGATISETVTTVTKDPPATTTETIQKEVRPAGAQPGDPIVVVDSSGKRVEAG